MSFKSYKEIFLEIEEQYFNGVHKNSKRRRSRNNISDNNSYNRTNKVYFDKILNQNECPTLDSLKSALYSWTPGTKSFKNAYYIYKKIASKATNSQELIRLFDGIDTIQTIFQEKQSISWNEFYNWHNKCSQDCQECDEPWLWVCAMCVTYGLRPSEIAAAQNLFKSWSRRNTTIKAINNPSNKDMLLVVGEFTYFGTSTKTGARIARPLILNQNIWDELRLKQPKLPVINSNSTNSKTLVNLFSGRFRKALIRMNCPITQPYAFRHLANQLGEKYGVPQEIRARSLGHSVAVNDSVYKSRSNLETEVDLLLNFSKSYSNGQEFSPFDFDMAVEKIKSIKAILEA
ncbi:recombinase [Okeania sp. KiyG1]|uniref:recombinase n=1 Tax=Okeania sp. KiyG1 TaxID=2720165 RepID=UPI0019216459|nr:recombinase [Okeania sp. KiyG1]GGA58678.1 hypothetical protein CYANOKiyG1_79960 [Okeania sp. KiyG1]